MIDRGPDNIGVLKLWAAKAASVGVDRVDRLMGNHEQIMLLAAAGGPYAHRARELWLTARMGGHRVLDEMRAATGAPAAALDQALLTASLGRRVVYCLNAMRSHVRLGNTVFVHGGLDPAAEPDEFLARPWTSFTDARWAWINRGFLDWRDGFNGLLVVHGHTPPALHREISGLADPHAFEGDRLGLDGGTTRTGFVTAAEIRDGRYRLLIAGRPIAPGA
jgi:serine/threonine protein phosphatase 1